MKGGREIEVPFEEAQRFLKSPQWFFKVKEGQKLTGQVINKAFVECTTIVHRDQQSFFRKENEKEKRIKVPGGWQRPDVRERMIGWWTDLKKQGCFQRFNSYQEWEKAKYNV